jgi:hypothetical protein
MKIYHSITVIIYKKIMRYITFFTHPIHDWQKRYEALRASFVDPLPAQVAADRFGCILPGMSTSCDISLPPAKWTLPNRCPKEQPVAIG